MKARSLVLFAAALCSLLTVVNPAAAQSTAFSYQGLLQDSGSPANGTYNFTVSLYTNSSGGPLVAGPVTTNGVMVTNGVFTVLIDFGPSPWNGATNWLEIGVETNTANSFTTLAPRQLITPTPYAIFATTASNVTGTLPVTQLTGTVPLGQLPGAVVTNGENGVSIAGAFSGNGGGLTNVPAYWQTVSGTSQTATANYAYLLTNNSLSTVTLPVTPNVGDIVTVSGVGSNGWLVLANAGQTIPGSTVIPAGVTWTAQNGAPVGIWQAVASSADGTKLVAVSQTGSLGGNVPVLGQIYTSTDSGVTWTVQSSAPIAAWGSVASSADGTKLVAVVQDGNAGKIYTSSDSGVTWIAQNGAPTGQWNCVASSTDGTKLVAALLTQIYTSSDSGVTWTAQNGAPALNWISLASSADGIKLVAAVGLGLIYTSGDSGVTWTAQNGVPSEEWSGVASSADGTKIVAASFGAPIYTSGDSGVTWTAQNSSVQNWYSVASSADGTKLVAGGLRAPIYTSGDSGLTWTQQNSGAQFWSSIAASADGAKLVAVAYGGQIYTSDATLAFSGAPNTAVQFQYVGNGVWQPLGQSASQIVGSIPATALPANVVTNTETGVTLSGTFNGNGAGLTGLNAANLTGTVPAAQLPASVVTNNETGVTLSGTFSGNGGGLTNLNVSGARVSTLTVTNLSISGTNEIAPLTVLPRLPASVVGSVSFGSGTMSAPAMTGGRYLYAVGGVANTLQVFDVSNPTSPAIIGSAATGSGPGPIAVAGRYAYVGIGGNGTLQVFDVGNPSLPVAVGSVAITNLTFPFGYPYAIAVSGHYVYAMNDLSSALAVIDVSVPSAPALVSILNLVPGRLPFSMALSGNYVYLADHSANLLQVVDVSNPVSPVTVASVSAGTFNDSPWTVAASGRYAYVGTDLGLKIFDVSNPAAPVLVSSTTAGGASPMIVVGHYLYEVGQIVDVSNPSAPVVVGSIGGGGPMAVSGRYVYTANNSTKTLQVIDQGGAFIEPLEAGTIETGTLQTHDTATVGNDLNVRGGLTVGGTAHISGGLSANDITGGLTTSIVVTVPTGTKTLFFTNGVLRAVQ